MLNVDQRHPRLQVVVLNTVVNNVNRSNAQEIAAPITEYTLDVADGTLDVHAAVLEVTTHKDLMEVAGTFSIKLTAQRDETGKTWAHKIEPMSYVEVHLRSDWTGNDNDVTLIMRGFVDNTSLVIGTAQDGSPQTYCLIEGRDYGKLFLRSLFFVSPQGEVVYGNHDSYLWLGPESSMNLTAAMSPITFVEAILKLTVSTNGSQVGMVSLPKGAPSIDLLVGKDLNNYSIYNPLEAPFTGSMWNWMSYYISKPYFEMFVTDDLSQSDLQALGGSALSHSQQQDRPVIVWRRSPYRDIHGNLAAPEAADTQFPDAPAIPLRFVQNISVGRSDQEAYNFFVAVPTAAGLDDTSYWQLYDNINTGAAFIVSELVQRFGFIPLEGQLTLLPQASYPGTTGSATQAQIDATNGVWIPKLRVLAAWLKACFAENYLYEQGTIQIRGDANYKIGRHAKIQETGQEFYIEGVDHSFSVDPLSFVTSLTVTRGRWPLSTMPYTVVDHPGLNLPTFDTGTTVPVASPATPITGTPAGNCSWVDPHPGAVCTQAYGPTSVAAEPAANGYAHFHMGIDLAHAGSDCGTPNVAVAHGTVIFAGLDPRSEGGAFAGLGNVVKIRLDDGSEVWYGHNASISVHAGQTVNQGDVIGLAGETGAAEGCHLHFEYHSAGGNTLDPGACLPQYHGAC